MKNAKHTPTPYGIGNTGSDQVMILSKSGKGDYVCSVQIKQHPSGGIWAEIMEPTRKANADFIIRACNAHDKLCALLAEVVDAEVWRDGLEDEIRAVLNNEK